MKKSKKKSARVSRTSQPRCSARLVYARMKASRPGQCVACGRKHGSICVITHTRATVGSQECYDLMMTAIKAKDITHEVL